VEEGDILYMALGFQNGGWDAGKTMAMAVRSPHLQLIRYMAKAVIKMRMLA
jgi:hypothetical protein